MGVLIHATCDEAKCMSWNQGGLTAPDQQSQMNDDELRRLYLKLDQLQDLMLSRLDRQMAIIDNVAREQATVSEHAKRELAAHGEHTWQNGKELGDVSAKLTLLMATLAEQKGA